MAAITLRLDDATRDEVELLARARGVSVSELLRVAIAELLGRDVDMPRADVPQTMSMVERRTLALLHEILDRLQPEADDEPTYHQRQIAVLNGGFSGEYSDEFGAIEPEIARAECQLMWDILDMFRVIKASIARLGEAKVAELGEHAEHALTFRGFDLNDSREARLLGYARHLIATGRWEDLAEQFDRRHERGNSHMPVLPTYQRMLAAYGPIWQSKTSGRGFGPDSLLLTSNELAEIVKAWPYLREDR